MIDINKLQNICNKIIFLLPQFKIINIEKLSSIPVQIEKMVVGTNKIPVFLDKTIQEITADDLTGVTEIGYNAFYYCTSLQSVTIPDSVTSIGNSAFSACNNLTDIYLNPTIPPSLGDTYTIPNTTTNHVPIGSGDAYKSATNWSYHSDRIVEDIQPS